MVPRPGRQAEPVTRGARNQLGLYVAMLYSLGEGLGINSQGVRDSG